MQEYGKSRNNFEQCIKCHLCEDVCPAMKADKAYPGPKRSGPDGERLRLMSPEFYDSSLKMCLNCKRCTVACPSGVNVADIIQCARERYDDGKGRHPVRDFLLANTDFAGTVLGSVAPVSNAITSSRLSGMAMDAFLKIDHRRTFPKYASKRFTTIFRKDLADSQSRFERKVRYFHGCYVQYNNPQLGVDFVKVMNALGYGVELLEKEKCCGLPMMSSGLYDNARKNASVNLASISKSEVPVLTTSTSCTLMMNDEYRDILGLSSAGVVPALKFIYQALQSGKRLSFRSDFNARVAYHKPCHGEKLLLPVFTKKLLRMIPGLNLTELDSNCCGIAGTYGFKKENYDRAQSIGKALFDQIGQVNPDYVACECETCKWQIEMSTPYSVRNPISIIAEALL